MSGWHPYKPKPNARPLDERSCAMRRLRHGGGTLKSIGEKFGVSGVRVRQILVMADRRLKYGYAYEPPTLPLHGEAE
jgi:DNA-directed RNA polymerase sigma subunit (sigma70/sigma32)